MKKIFLAFLISFFSLFVKAQVQESSEGTPASRVHVKGEMMVDSMFLLPYRDTTVHPIRAGGILYKFSNRSLYFWDAISWKKISSTDLIYMDTLYTNTTKDTLKWIKNFVIYSVPIGKGILSINSVTTNTQTLQTGTTGTNFNISSDVASGIHTFNLPLADASHTGKLSSTDWADFNSKVPGSRQLTINGVTFDLTANRSWTITQSLAHVHGIANSAGTEQFTFGIGEDVRIEGAGSNIVTFDPTTKKITITGTSGSGADGNNYPTVLDFNTSTGDLTVQRSGLSTLTKNLDGRYLRSFTESDPIALAKTISLTAGFGAVVSGSGTQALSVNPSWSIKVDTSSIHTSIYNDGRYLQNITAYLQAGTNIGLAGTGTSVDPYIISSTSAGTITGAGNLIPLFTTSISSTTITFTLTAAAANTYFGNATGSTGAPSYTAAGALTKTDDTNVTLTLGGNPATSLLRAVSITVGWTGQLSVDRGGTGQASYTNGQLLIGNTTGNTLTKATLTAGSGISITNGTGSITIAASGLVTGVTGTTPITVTGTTAPVISLDDNGITNAKIRQSAGLSVIGRSTNSTGNVADITAGTEEYILQRLSGTLQFGQLTTGGITNANVTYAKIQDVTGQRFLGRYNVSNGTVQEGVFSNNFTWNASTGLLSIDYTTSGQPNLQQVTTNGNTTNVGIDITNSASFRFLGSTSGIITFKAAAIAGTATYTWPTSLTSGYVLSTDGSGNLSWIAQSVASVSNADGTLTISPTTGSVVASIALGHANTWTGKQTFSTSTISITGGTNGYILSTDGSGTLSWISNTGGGGTVTSIDVSGGTTGLTTSGGPVTGSGTITFAGTLITSNGGTGLSSWTQGDVPYYNSGTVLSKLAKSTTANQFFSNGGTSNNPAWTTITAAMIGSGAALTKTDDANVTLTLGGTPAAALLTTSSITVGWTGQLSVSRGGTGNSTFTAYSVIVAGTTSTGAFQNVSGVGTTGQVLTSNGASALPTWQTISGVGTVTNFIFTDGNGFDGTVTSSTSTPTLSLTTTVSDTRVMYSNGGALTGASNFTFTGQALQLGSTNTTQGTTSSALVMTLNSLTSGTGFYAASSSLSSGSLMSLVVTGTAAASSTQTVLNISTSGANATSSQTTYGVNTSNTHTGTTSVNYGISGLASGAASSNIGVYGEGNGTGSIGVYGVSTSANGIGLRGGATDATGTALFAYASGGGQAGLLQTLSTATSSSVEVLRIVGSTSGTPAPNIGAYISTFLQTSSTGGQSEEATRISSKWTTSTHASQVSAMEFMTFEPTGGIGVKFTIAGSGALKASKYGIGTFTGTPAYHLAVTSGGDIIEVAAGGTSYTFTDPVHESGGTVTFLKKNDFVFSSGSLALNQTPYTLTDGSSITYDADNGSVQVLTTGTNRRTISMSNQLSGRYYSLIVYSTANNDTLNLPGGVDGILPASGDSCEFIDHVYNTTHHWVKVGGASGGGVTTMGTFGSSPNNNGGTISGSTLTLQPADITHPGGITTGTQSISGSKTFTYDCTFSANLFVTTDLAVTGNISNGTWHGSTITGTYGGTGVNNGSKTITISGNVTIGSSTNTIAFVTSGNTSITLPTSGTLATLGGAETFSGVKTFSAAPVISTITNTGTLTFPTVTGTLVQFAESSTASSSTPTPSGDARENFLDVTALAANATFGAPSGTAVNHNKIVIRIKDNGTSRTLSWNSIYRAGTDLPLPTATEVGKTIYCTFYYNSADSKFDYTGETKGF